MSNNQKDVDGLISAISNYINSAKIRDINVIIKLAFLCGIASSEMLHTHDEPIRPEDIKAFLEDR